MGGKTMAGLPPTSAHLDTRVERGIVRVKCPAQECSALILLRA